MVERVVTELVVDARQGEISAKRYEESLKKAAAAAERARTANSNLAQSAAQASAPLRMQERTTRAVEQSLERLRNRIDPAHRATRQLERGQRDLDRALQRGLITQREAARLTRLLEDRYRNLDRSTARLSTNFATMERTVGRLRTVMAGLAGVMAFRGLVRTNQQFEQLAASLRTVTGSSEAAADAMSRIVVFAAETPFDLQQVTEAFIRLRSLGLDASTDSLRSFGNTAAAMGRPIMQFIEAVADAATGQFERLREFGIRATTEGERVAFTFQGVTTQVGRSAEEITAFLRQIGETQFAGAMAQQMDTLAGRFSNLRDASQQLAIEVGQAGLNDALRDVTGTLTRMTSESSDAAQQLGQALGSAVRTAGASFEFLAENAEAARIAVFALIGARLGFIINPWAGAVGGLAGALLGMATAADDVSDAMEHLNEIQRQSRDLMRDLNAATEESTSLLISRQRELVATAARELDAAQARVSALEAELATQAALVASPATSFGGALFGASTEAQLRTAREEAAAAAQSLREQRGALEGALSLNAASGDAAIAQATGRLGDAPTPSSVDTLRNAIKELRNEAFPAERALEELRSAQEQLAEAVGRTVISQEEANEIEAALQEQYERSIQNRSRDARAIETQTRRRDEAIVQAAREVGQLQVLQSALEAGTGRYEAAAREIEITNEARRLGIDLSSKEGRAWRENLLEADRLTAGIERTRGAYEDQERAAVAALERQRREVEKLTETLADDLSRALVDPLFEGRDAFEDFGRFLSDWGRRVAAELARAFFIQPIIAPVFAGAAGAAGVSGGNVMTGGTGGGLGFNQISLPNFGGLGGFFNTPIFGATPATSPSLLGVAPVPGGVPVTPAFPGFTLGGALSGALGGFGVGSFVGPLIGGNPLTSGIGGALGGVAGTAVTTGFSGIASALGGTAIAGPIGAIGGGIVGGLLGGLFGGGRSLPPRAEVILESAGGRLRVDRLLTDNGGNAAALAGAANPAIQQVNAIAQTFGGRIQGRNFSLFRQGDEFQVIRDIPGPQGDVVFRSGDANAAVERLVIEVLQRNLVGLEGNVRRALRNSPAGSIEQLVSDLEFAQFVDGLESAARPLGSLAQQLTELADQFEGLEDRARGLRLNVSRLDATGADEFDRIVGDLVRQTTDPLGFALDSLTSDFDAIRDAARRLGGDLEQVNELYELQRQAITAQSSALREWLDAQGLGPTSSLSPTARFDEAQRQFGDLLDRARGGDFAALPGLTGAADTLLQAGLGQFARSTTEFTTLEQFIRSSIEAIGRQLELPGFQHGTSYAPAGLAIVGEAGPEIVRLRGGEQILPADETRQLLGMGPEATRQAAMVFERGFGEMNARLERVEKALNQDRLARRFAV